jgi:Tfp pilus assembly protein FimV
MKYLKLFFLAAVLSADNAGADEGFVVLEYRSTQHGSSGNGVYYRVQPGDTLAKIVAQHYDQGGNRDELFRQIISTNPRAFIGSDPDRLLSGSVLNMPSFGASSGNRRDDIYFF